jgi:pSer/pThr/pTyr-binding forkhead associated (FHA) protein
MPAPKVRIEQTEPEQRSWGEFTQEEILIGKRPECHVMFAGVPTISGVHAILSWRDGTLWVRDRCATHGVTVNGRPMGPQAEVELPSGARLGLGKVVLVVSYEPSF